MIGCAEKQVLKSINIERKVTMSVQIKRIRALLRNDKDQALATKKEVSRKDYSTHYRAIVRMTKKAASLLYPQFKILVRQSRSRRGGRWIHVNIIVEKTIDSDTHKEIESRTTEMLEKLGFSYSSYLTDYGGPGGETRNPCLLVLINDINYKHY